MSMAVTYSVEKSWYRPPHTHHTFRGWAIRLTDEDGSTSIVRYCPTVSEAYALADEWQGYKIEMGARGIGVVLDCDAVEEAAHEVPLRACPSRGLGQR